MALNIITYSTNLANTASGAYWGALNNALRTNSQLSSADLTVYLNENGEYVNYSPQTVANLIYNGGIWIDWCGWPFYYNDFYAFTAGVPLPALYSGASRFGALIEAMGYQMGYQNLGYPAFAPVPSGVPYPRSLLVSGSVSIPTFTPNPNVQSYDIGGVHVYPSFAIRYGTGAYIYAFGSATPINNPFDPFYITAGQAPQSVTPSEYIPFVEQVMSKVLGYGSTAKSPPSCGSSYGTYVGNTSQGYFIYASTKNGVLRNTVIDAQCTPQGVYYHGGTGTQTEQASQYAGSSVQAIGGSSSGATGVSNASCSSLGVYIGTGASVGANPKYAAYKFFAPDGYTINLADPTASNPCAAVASYFHHTSAAATPSTGTSGSSTPSTGSSGSASTTPVTGSGHPSPGGSGTSTGGSANLLTNPYVLIGGGLGVAGLLWWLMRRGE